MIVGDPQSFAIESHLTKAFERLSFRALGFFVIYLSGLRFGVMRSDATMLACSVDQVAKRVADRGRHTAPFASVDKGERIARAFWDTLYGDQVDDHPFGMPDTQFERYFQSDGADCMWAPDGDQAFDDGSFVLQFDIGDKVRLIAFKTDAGAGPVNDSIRDTWISAEDFYRLLSEWLTDFNAAWAQMAKSAD